MVRILPDRCGIFRTKSKIYLDIIWEHRYAHPGFPAEIEFGTGVRRRIFARSDRDPGNVGVRGNEGASTHLIGRQRPLVLGMAMRPPPMPVRNRPGIGPFFPAGAHSRPKILGTSVGHALGRRRRRPGIEGKTHSTPNCSRARKNAQRILARQYRKLSGRADWRLQGHPCNNMEMSRHPTGFGLRRIAFGVATRIESGTPGGPDGAASKILRNQENGRGFPSKGTDGGNGGLGPSVQQPLGSPYSVSGCCGFRGCGRGSHSIRQ
ncbi:hypothetical protein JOF47_001313 [Paeniglutamicibacter kerguelensis]|uniref:Uncharacterized protein n=1 Tax=Paeniglutamicibacter kerguelensis TaxID=254788 RepID=A0ABS4XBE5_9MICC|nr:hypothetical protein [Paeniglutamicibacter kerguelensis]